MQDGDISNTKFQKVLQQRENYLRLRAEIRNQTRTKKKETTKEQREKLLEQGKKECKEDFLLKIAGTLGTQSVDAI